MNQPDVVVIGAGPGGYVAAIRMAQLGLKVTVVEREQLGGTCLNWGCIPSKALIYASDFYHRIQSASKMGIHVSGLEMDIPQLQRWKAGVVKKLTGGIGQLLKANGAEVLYGEATFVNATTLEITSSGGGPLRLTPRFIVIATGSKPVIPSNLFLDGDYILDSREALSLDSLPKSIAVVGGGYIGLEMAFMLSRLGVSVTVVEALPTLLGGLEPEIVEVIRKSLKKNKIQLLTHTQVVQSERTEAGVRLSLKSEDGTLEPLEVEKVLVAVGRQPNTDGLHLEATGIKLTDRGFIPVDFQCRTPVPHIFAMGDVTGGMMLAHKASKEALVVADVIAGKNSVLDYRAIPAVMFTDPEISSVGLTEAQALAKGFKVKIGKFPFAASGRAMAMSQTDGLIKIVSEANTDRVLGVHMVGPDVSQLIAEATLAIEMHATTEDIALTIHAHPTLSESVMEAAEALHHRAIHIFQPQ